jgi:YafQ family addiction module toxin component
MHKIEIEAKLKKVLDKLYKKDKHKFEIVWKKIDEIVGSFNVEHYKNLKRPLQEFKRVHIDRNFVLIFKYFKSKDVVRFYDLDHHSNIYRK